MLKQFKKVLSLMLVLALVLPGMVFASKSNDENGVQSYIEEQELTREEQKNVDDAMKLIQDIIEEHKVAKDLEVDYDDNEIVRIIVELKEKPVIVYATESGQRYEDMSYSQRSSIESQIYAAQEAVKNQIAARNINMVYGRSFNTVFSGFSGEVKFEDIEDIEIIPGVKKVYISNEYEKPVVKPEMVSSHDMIGSKDVWGSENTKGYKGEGMVVAIIDTGVDPSHKDMVLSEGTKQTITKDSLDEKYLDGKYFTPKVPYGYNYYDLNDEILDLGPKASEHGMHVAGTVAANGEIKGVAPEAQLLAMKVFSNDPIYATTFDDIYIAAIEDAVKLKANALNMSLGGTAGFYVQGNALETVITNAIDNGIVCAIAAGNEGYTYYGWDKTNYGLPFKEDPDYGVVGSPSVEKDCISVASIDNLKMKTPYLEYSIAGVAEVLPVNTFIINDEAFYFDLLSNDAFTQKKAAYALDNNIPIYVKTGETQFYDIQGKSVKHDKLPEIVEYRDENKQTSKRSVLPGGTTGEGEVFKVPMMVASEVQPTDVFGTEQVEFVDCGLGKAEDFEGKKIEGKVALIERGDNTFVEKIQNAEAARAAGVIIYNHENGGEELFGMMYPSNGTIPAVSIARSNGLKMKDLKDKKVSFPEGEILADNATGGKMSDFSSMGTTPNLELKPEITAPGGNIYSTLQNNQYGYMSGTSMATPHLAGGSALIMQYIKTDEKFENIKDNLDAQTRLAKVLLMNTAKIVMDEDMYEDIDVPYTPRKQGAGLMNVNAAVNTPVTVVNKDNNEAKVELKDFEETSFTMNLIAKNYSSEDVIYDVDVDVLADYIIPESDINVLGSRYVEAEKTITVDRETVDKITVPQNSEKEFTVKVDFTTDKDIYRNMFIEGFVKLTNDNVPELSVPYVGFYGDWSEPRILDAMKHEKDNRSYYEQSEMLKVVPKYNVEIPYEAVGEITEINPSIVTYEEDKFVVPEFVIGFTFKDNGKEKKANFDEKTEKWEIDEQEVEFSYKAYDSKYYGFGGKIAFSPEENKEKTHKVLPLPSFLRNAEEVEWNVLDEDGNKLRTITKENYVRKSYFNRGLDKPFSFVPARAWDGKVRGKIAEDGRYIYQIRARVQNKNKWQEKNIEVFVDTIAPTISDLKYDQETGKLTWAAIDGKGTGIETFYIIVNNDFKNLIELDPEKVKVAEKENEYEYDMKETMDELLKDEGDNKIEVVASDYAWNEGYSDIIVSNDVEIPYIYLKEPELLEVYDKQDIKFSGYVLKNNEIKNVKVNGEEAEVKFDDKIEHKLDDGSVVIVPGYRFNYTLKGLEDGVHQVKVEAESLAGNKASIVRRFFVDTKQPELSVVVKAREEDSDTAELEITMKDNFPVLTLYVYDSEEFNYDDLYPYLNVKEVEENTTITVDLELGTNLIPIKLVDIAGNEIIKTVTIERTAPSDEKCVASDKEALEIIFAEGDSTESVTQDLILSNMGKLDSNIKWESNNKDVITNDGKVTRPAKDTVVTLTATISKGEATDTKEFTVTVKATEPVNKTELDAKITEAEKLEARFYVEESWTIFVKALEDAKLVTATESATQDEVNEALTDLTAAIEGLEELPLDQIITAIDGKYGTLTQEEKQIYVAYILFNIKEEFVEENEDVVVLIDGVELEMKEDGKGFNYRFEGMLDDEPKSVIIKIGDNEFDVTELCKWNEEKVDEADTTVFEEIFEILNK